MSNISYSKWDAIELSDDEEFECHPNVDKKSMVRWKQAQIHKERREREDQRDLLKLEYEATIRFLDVMPKRIAAISAIPPTTILPFLAMAGEAIDKEFTEPMRQESLKRMTNWPGNWEPPVWGPVLQSHVPWNEEINKITAAVDEYVKKGENMDNCAAFTIALFEKAFERFKARQPVIMKQIKDFEKEMNKKLTQDHLVTGFDKTMVAKKDRDEREAPAADQSSKSKKVIETIHNPKKIDEHAEYLKGIFEEMECRDSDLAKIHPQLVDYSKKGDFGDIVRMLRQFPTLQTEKIEEQLLLLGICLSCVNQLGACRIAVQNSLILKYTRNLGNAKNGIELFFSKLSGAGTSAQNLFYGDLNTTYEHISKRGGVLRSERLEKKKNMDEAAEKKKEIYATFLQADGTLKLPLGEEPSATDLKQKEWFDALPEDYKQGLLLEDVDKINAYLGSLPPDEASFQANVAAKSGFIQFEEDDEEESEVV